jgi:NDP-sugar pyrophosphorylase family protein
MKAVILAGVLGTRLSEETDLKPKSMLEIGGKPMLKHSGFWQSMDTPAEKKYLDDLYSSGSTHWKVWE